MTAPRPSGGWRASFERLGGQSTVGNWYAQYELGWIALTDGDAATARRHFHSVLTVIDGWPGMEIQTAHLLAGVALVEAIEGNTALALARVRQAVEVARDLALPSITVMALVRSAEVAAVTGTPIGPELPEALRLLRAQGSLRWVAAALTVAAVVHESRGHPDVVARLLGGAVGVATALGEEPLPLPAVAALVSAVRPRLDKALGPGGRAEAETAGRNMPLPSLLDLALDGVDG